MAVIGLVAGIFEAGVVLIFSLSAGEGPFYKCILNCLAMNSSNSNLQNSNMTANPLTVVEPSVAPSLEPPAASPVVPPVPLSDNIEDPAPSSNYSVPGPGAAREPTVVAGETKTV